MAPRAVTCLTALGQRSHQIVTQNCQTALTLRTPTASQAAAAAGGVQRLVGQQGAVGVELGRQVWGC